MSALTGAFEGLGRGISKEADRKLKKWDDERVLKEQEKLIIAREKRIDAAARSRQADQNTWAAEKSGLLRTQTEADMKQKHEWDVDAAKLKASSDQKVARIKATGGGAAYNLKDRVKFVIVDKYDKDGYVIGQEAKGWDIVNQRWLTEDEENHGISNVASANALAAALVKKKEEAAKKAADLAKDKDKGKDTPSDTSSDTPSDTSSDTPPDTSSDTPPDTSSDTSNTGLINTGKKLTAAQFQELTPAEKYALLTGGYNKSIEDQNEKFTTSVKQLTPTREGVISGRNRTKRKTPPNTPITTKQISELPKAKIPLGKPVPAVEGRPQVDYNYGKRHNSETLKGNGWFGPLLRKNRKEGASTEISAGFEIEGKEVEIPLLVPTLTPEEVTWLLSTPMNDLMGKLPKSISLKAVEHAKKRLSEGKSPFYDN